MNIYELVRGFSSLFLKNGGGVDRNDTKISEHQLRRDVGRVTIKIL